MKSMDAAGWAYRQAAPVLARYAETPMTTIERELVERALRAAIEELGLRWASLPVSDREAAVDRARAVLEIDEASS